MGAPGYTKFCEKGHIVERCGHHEMIEDEINICPICQSKKVKTVIEWRDPEYDSKNPIVPYKPKIVEIKNKIICPHCNKVVRIDKKCIEVYNVSKLFKNRKKK